MTPPLQLVDGALVVSPTQLAAMQTCPTYWKHNYLYRRVSAGTHPARDGGKATDDALNLRYREVGSGPVPSETESRMLDAIDIGFEGLDLPLDEYRTAARYKEVVQAYNVHYMVEDHEVLGVQVEFEVVLGEVEVLPRFWASIHASCAHNWQIDPCETQTFLADPRVHCSVCRASKFSSQPDKEARWIPDSLPVHLRGICDRIIRMPSGHVRVVDTKTANKFNGWAEFRNSGQLKGYCWALPRWFATHPDPKWADIKRVDGAMVDLIVIRPPYKGGDARKPKASDTPRTEFHRMEFSYSEERLEEWRASSLALVEQALGWVARDHFPQYEKSCAWLWGKPCPYLDVCVEPAASRETVLGCDLFKDYKRDDVPEEEAV